MNPLFYSKTVVPVLLSLLLVKQVLTGYKFALSPDYKQSPLPIVLLSLFILVITIFHDTNIHIISSDKKLIINDVLHNMGFLKLPEI